MPPGGEDGLAIESKTLTLGAYGGDMDFYAMKGVIEAVLKELRVKDVTFRTGSGFPEEASYHPGRFAEVWSGSDCLGWFGQIHPLVATELRRGRRVLLRGAGHGRAGERQGCRPGVRAPAQVPRRHPGHRRGVRQRPSPWERWRTASAGAPRGF